MDKEIRTQEVVDKDTVVVCSSANDNRPGRKGWEVGLYQGFRGWKEADDDKDYESEDDVNYNDNSEYDRRHVKSNNMIPNQSQKYQHWKQIDDFDYNGDDEDEDQDEFQQQQNQKEEAIHEKEKTIKRSKNKQRNNINKNNMIAHIRYTDLEINRSDEIYESTFWCHFNSHAGSRKKKKKYL